MMEDSGTSSMINPDAEELDLFILKCPEKSKKCDISPCLNFKEILLTSSGLITYSP